MTTPDSTGAGYPGQLGLYSANSEFNVTVSIFNQLLAKVRTATIVKINSCTVNDVVGPIGFVNATPMIGLVDGLLQVSPHGVIHNLAYMRVQGGSNAIIIDPQPGDVGLAVICDRDISVVKTTGAACPPGSRRRFDLADGVYCFPIISAGGAAPTQYWRFNPNGMDALDKNGNTIVMDSAGVHINGVLFDRSQNVSSIKDITNSGNANLSGASQAVKLADGTNSTKVKAT